MKIYNEIVFNVDGDVIYEDSYEYSGEIHLLKKGKGRRRTTDTTRTTVASTSSVADTSGLSEHDEVLQDILDAFEGAVEEAESYSPTSKAGIDPQLSPLPSLPSISNVGTVSPTGAVNRSAIPGGFQPLPQAGGGAKKIYQLSQFHGGNNIKSSPRDISDQECQKSLNLSLADVGRIKLLGTIKNEDASLKTTNGSSYVNLPGYGLFTFFAPADNDGTTGGENMVLYADGDQVDVIDASGVTPTWIDMAGTESAAVAQIYYAAGNGVYVGDASFLNTPVAKIYVSRKDINGTVAVTGWSTAYKRLIDSPDYGTSTDGVSHEDSADTSITDEAHTGAMNVMTHSIGTGTWNAIYEFYVSYLFDGGVETGLSNIGEDTFSNESCAFNVSLQHTNADPFGGDAAHKRIEGARIYFKEQGTSERWLLAEVSLVDGVKGALDSTFIPWSGSNPYKPASNIVFVNPPSVYSYSSLNGYYANEVYTSSPDAVNTAPTAISLKYKTCVVGQRGVAFIGNVEFDGKHMPDSMMFSMPGKPGVFPKFNVFDSPSSDGSEICALASYQDVILQFKQDSLAVINVSNPQQFYAEAVYRDCGVLNPCQVFTTSFGVIFVNKFGCYLYDGQKVISLTDGKIGSANWGITENKSNQTDSYLPCIGFDARSQNIIIIKNIGDDHSATTCWAYNMTTQSWTEGDEVIVNGDGTRHTNFITSHDGYLQIRQHGDPVLQNYNATPSAAIKIRYQTKDFDFGLPSQTKKLFKVYVTFKGDPSNVLLTYGVDGAALVNGASAGSSADDMPYSFTTSGWSNSTTLSVATFTPADTDEAKDWKSICLNFNTGTATVATTFEINDIAILYRARPIK